MKQDRKYCCYCGAGIARSEIEGKERDRCTGCAAVFYENPLPVVSCIVVNEDRSVLLIRRKKEPYRGMWCLPIGFAESGEDMRDAALRELEEEAGVRGSIVRLIDVDTVDNYFYGPLAIVTYEVRVTGGLLAPGDDADDAGYFPITECPPLAWSSNEKALSIYHDMYRDTWAMVDSFRHLFPEMEMAGEIAQGGITQGELLSNVLIQIIDKDREEILNRWMEDVHALLPHLAPHGEDLMALNSSILETVQACLRGDADTCDFRDYARTGRLLKEAGVALPDLLTIAALSRKTIWTHVVKRRLLKSPLEIYTALELNNRIIFLYDKINYYLTMRWVS